MTAYTKARFDRQAAKLAEARAEIEALQTERDRLRYQISQVGPQTRRMIDELIRLKGTEMTIPELLRQAKSDAWEEGYLAATDDQSSGSNPYYRDDEGGDVDSTT